MCPLIVSIRSLHLSGQEACLPGIYHHPELCQWGKCLRDTEKLIKINLAFTFSTWCLRRHCREGHGNGWTSCPLFFIISLCLRCLFVQWREWSEEGLAQWPWSSQRAAPCGRTLWTTLQEGCRASLLVSLHCWGISGKKKKEKESKNTEDGIANPLLLCVPRSPMLLTLFLLIQTNTTSFHFLV